MDKNDAVIAIAASLYASRATEDALRAEPDLGAIGAVQRVMRPLPARARRAQQRFDAHAPTPRPRLRDPSRCPRPG
jgi:hypothetical protein